MKLPYELYLEVSPFRVGCWFSVTKNKEEAKKWFNKKYNQTIDLCEHGDAHAVLSNPCVILLFNWKNTPTHISNLAHECVHVANHIIDFVSIKEKKGCDEVQAYLVGYLVDSFLTAIKKKN
jgi:hypothetical protein